MCTDKYVLYSCKHVICERNPCKAFLAWKKKSKSAKMENCRNYKKADEKNPHKCMRAGEDYCIKPGMAFDAQGTRIADKTDENNRIDLGEGMAVDDKAEDSREGGALGDLKDEMVMDKPERVVPNVQNILQNALQKVVQEKAEVGNDDPQANLKKSRWA